MYVHQLSTPGRLRNDPPSGLLRNTREVVEFPPDNFLVGGTKKNVKQESQDFLNKMDREREINDKFLSGMKNRTKKNVKQESQDFLNKMEREREIHDKFLSGMKNRTKKNVKQESQDFLNKMEREMKNLNKDVARVETMAQKMQRLRDIKKAKKESQDVEERIVDKLKKLRRKVNPRLSSALSKQIEQASLLQISQARRKAIRKADNRAIADAKMNAKMNAKRYAFEDMDPYSFGDARPQLPEKLKSQIRTRQSDKFLDNLIKEASQPTKLYDLSSAPARTRPRNQGKLHDLSLAPVRTRPRKKKGKSEEENYREYMKQQADDERREREEIELYNDLNPELMGTHYDPTPPRMTGIQYDRAPSKKKGRRTANQQTYASQRAADRQREKEEMELYNS